MTDSPTETSMAIPSLGMQLSDLDLRVRTAIENVEDDADPGEMINIHGAVKELKRLATQWSKLADGRFIGYLQNGDTHEVQTGTIRYYVGTPKKVVQKVSNAVMTERLLDIFGGDTGQVSECMVKSPFKQGQVKELTSEAFHSEMYETQYDDTLKEGKPNKKLVVVDSKWLK